MRLKQLKLSGFKSFVDSTVVPFPSQLVAVVGPNGCGKSNIIDAVRWVMGESSAKNLRGEAMTDVIFNGSTNRKSVGQAAVELVFDNSLGRLAGPFASYGEIAVKRVVTRDGESSYYLNGTRCRRKDITDIFLGTGAGARGYSIIGQGTISRLIEARPEELRAYLEEAAGVSKYKERRRETLQRIAHTRENLTRVADIRDELDKQLQRLERQAKAAERYVLLKEEEKLCRAEIVALKWRDLKEQQGKKRHELQQLSLAHEHEQTLLTAAQSNKLIIAEQLHDADAQAQQSQAVFYQVGTDIARLQEQMEHRERERKRLEQDKQQLQSDWQHANDQLRQDKEQLLLAQEQALNDEQLLTAAQEELLSKEQQLTADQQQQHFWETRWLELQQQMQSINSEIDIAQVNTRHLEQKRQQTLLRLEKINNEAQGISLEKLQQQLQQLLTQKQQFEQQVQVDEQSLTACEEQLQQGRMELHHLEQNLQHTRDHFHQKNSEYAALLAAQKTATSANQPSQPLPELLNNTPRLVELLQVESAWQFACECLLYDELQAFVLSDLADLWPVWSECLAANYSIVTLKKAKADKASYPKLVDYMSGDIPHTVCDLNAIYAAQHIEEALNWLPHLQEHESIITQQGIWLGPGWVKLRPALQEDEMGLLARQQRLAEVQVLVEELQQQIRLIQEQRDKVQEKIQTQSAQASSLRSLWQSSTEQLREHISALSRIQQELAHAELIVQRFSSDQEELQQQLEESSMEQHQLALVLQTKAQQLNDKLAEQQHFRDEKHNWTQQVDSLRRVVEEQRAQVHQLELSYDRCLHTIEQLKQKIDKEEERLLILQERLEQLAVLTAEWETPKHTLQEQLATLLLHHQEVETQLVVHKEQLAALKAALHDKEKEAVKHDNELKNVQEQINNCRMQEQALAVRATALEESLSEEHTSVESLLEFIATGVTQAIREEQLISINEKIKRLGPINLAAIEEYNSEQQRKLYLDEQYNDLNQALTTLETAIEKMDKETRLRFADTFEQVNISFKALFPRLFGGGKAQLELTCDNLLEAGIVVMAQPPGKRNSTIHLLSGGEKAMTAVALVFAIFQLNPSPFCMLDEVDAPLDDVNVGRFCEMVREMSQFVQFLFITHNKVTMELADHLIGVTMREPGVSRLVAVDVKEALTME